jgi:hypothetical protein
MSDSNWPKCEMLGEHYIKVIVRFWTPEGGIREQESFTHPMPSSSGHPELNQAKEDFAVHCFAFNCEAALLTETYDGDIKVIAHHTDFDWDSQVLPEEAIE